MGENLCAKNTVCATIDLGHFSIDINEQKKKIPSQNSLAILCHTKVCAKKKKYIRETIHRNARPQKDQFMCVFFLKQTHFFDT